ncbi:uncharacterized protein [Ptychodera flava]|uniref:uncharacterized protein n=1 Tax=Ptychodera flava TaxID=63121 RepID=UPI00396A04B8
MSSWSLQQRHGASTVRHRLFPTVENGLRRYISSQRALSRDQCDSNLPHLRKFLQAQSYSEKHVQSGVATPFSCHDLFHAKNVRMEPVGSNYEGFALPEMLPPDDMDITETRLGEIVSDEVDVNIVIERVVAREGDISNTFASTDDNNATTNQEYIVDVEFCTRQPGYAFIKVTRKESAAKLISVCRVMVGDGQYQHCEVFLSPVGMVSVFQIRCELLAFMENLYAAIGERHEQLQHHIGKEGPAVHWHSIYDHGTETFDMAIAIPCQSWPSVAKEWLTRDHRSGWPSESLKERVVRTGCMLVPKSPENSTTLLEWRLSFSLAERDLAEDLTDAQRTAYVFFKQLYKLFLKHPTTEGIKSYHLKNIFFRMLEQIPRPYWSKDDIVPRVMDLLYELNTCLLNMNCPHYFLPGNNLFDGIEDSVLMTIQQRLQIIILKPAHPWCKTEALLSVPSTQSRNQISKELKALEREIRRNFFDSTPFSLAENPDSKLELAETSLREAMSKVIEESIEGGRSPGLTENLLIEMEKTLTTVFPSAIERFENCLVSKLAPKQVLLARRRGFFDYATITLASSQCLELFFNKLVVLEESDFTFGDPAIYKLFDDVEIDEVHSEESDDDNGEDGNYQEAIKAYGFDYQLPKELSDEVAAFMQADYDEPAHVHIREVYSDDLSDSAKALFFLLDVCT